MFNCIVNISDNTLFLSHNDYLIKEAQYLEKYSFRIFCTFYMTFVCKQSAKGMKCMHRVNKTCRYIATETKTEK